MMNRMWSVACVFKPNEMKKEDVEWSTLTQESMDAGWSKSADDMEDEVLVR